MKLTKVISRNALSGGRNGRWGITLLIALLTMAAQTAWAQEPYQISNYEQLKAFAQIVNESNVSACAQLTADITCNDQTWTPIGNDIYHKYTGTFDGMGYKITGLSNANVATSPNYAGLFGAIGSSAEVRGITLAEANITGSIYTGGIVGWNDGGTVTNCHVTNTVAVSGSGRNGGIVGDNGGSVTFCTSGVQMSGSPVSGSPAYSGGIVGCNSNSTSSTTPTVTDNFVIGAVIPAATYNRQAAIAVNFNYQVNTVYERNYYYGCTVAGTPNATNVGIAAQTAEGAPFTIGDVSSNDGAVRIFALTLDDGVTADNATVTYGGKGYYKQGTTVTLSLTGTPTYNVMKDGTTENVEVTNNQFTMPDNDVTVTVFTMAWADLKTAIEAGGTVTLTGNVLRNAAETIVIENKTVTLDLNGYTIDGGGNTYAYYPTIRVTDGGTLTVTDGSTNHDGSFTNLHGVDAIEVYGTDGSNYGSVTLADGFIASGGVYIDSYGRFTMTGGTITITGNSTGVDLNENGTFTMTGGTITGNSTGVDLGVNDNDNVTFTMTGGSITGNAVGVGVYSANAKFTVSGNVNITGNTDKDVNMKYNIMDFYPIHIGGALASTARIGINIPDAAATYITGDAVKVITDGLKGKGTKQNFVLNGRDGLALVPEADGEVGIATAYMLTVPSNVIVSGLTPESNGTYKVGYSDVITLNYSGDVADGKSAHYTIAEGAINYLGAVNAQGKCFTFTMPASDASITKDDDKDYTFAGITLKEGFTGSTSTGLYATFDGSSLATISIPTAISVGEVTLNRTFTPGKPATLMLPFNGNDAYGGAEANKATFYTFTGVALNETTQKWEATMTELDKGDTYHYGPLVANTPYIVVPTATSITLFNKGTLCTEGGGGQETKPSGSNWTFKGTYAYREWITGDANSEEIGKAYGFAGVPKTGIAVGDFVKVASGAKIRPMGCYLLWSDTPNAARRMTRGAAADELPQRITVRLVGSNGETTAIGELDTATGEITFDGWWTLDGIRLSGKPAKKGLYIHNGRKEVLK